MTGGGGILPTGFDLRETHARTIGTALVVSVLVHALVIGLLPGMRPAKIDRPLLLTIDLAPVPETEPAVQTPAPVPTSPAPTRPMPERVQPPIRTEPKAEPPIQTAPAPAPERRIEVAPAPVPEVPPTPRAEPERPPEIAPPSRAEPTVQAQPPPPAPPPAVPQVDRAELGRLYGQQLHDAVERNKRPYPRMAQMRRWEGVVEIRVQLGADGKVAEVSISRSSGFEVLDQQALDMVKAAAAQVEVPHPLRGVPIPVNVPVRFRLQSQ